MRLKRLASSDTIKDFKGYLAEGTEFSGDLKFSDLLRIDGTITGTIFSDGELMVGQTGKIQGKIEVSSILISGSIEGTIIARQKVHIHSTGKFHGELYTPTLIVEEGALFDGKCNMSRPEPAGLTEVSKGIEKYKTAAAPNESSQTVNK